MRNYDRSSFSNLFTSSSEKGTLVIDDKSPRTLSRPWNMRVIPKQRDKQRIIIYLPY